MNAKSLWKISANVPAQAEEAVLELFERVFQQPCSSYLDVETGVSTVAVYLQRQPRLSATQRAQLAEGFKRIRECGLKIGRPRLSLKKLPGQDWAESWKRHFHPIEIGSALLIKPSWSRRRPKNGQATIVLDPGLSFGTGQHPTTEFCLRGLAAKRRGEPKPRPPYRDSGKTGTVYAFLDIGTGSGILAIAAARLGYKPVEAFDFDPEAIRVAKANARRNGVLNKICFYEQDVTNLRRTGRKFAVICANLIANLLIEVRDRLVARLAPGGTIVLAGILKTEFEAVQRVYEKAGLRLVASQTEMEWRSGSFVRRKSTVEE